MTSLTVLGSRGTAGKDPKTKRQHDMLIGNHQGALPFSLPKSQIVSKSVDETVRLAVSIFLYGTAVRPS